MPAKRRSSESKDDDDLDSDNTTDLSLSLEPTPRAGGNKRASIQSHSSERSLGKQSKKQAEPRRSSTSSRGSDRRDPTKNADRSDSPSLDDDDVPSVDLSFDSDDDKKPPKTAPKAPPKERRRSSADSAGIPASRKEPIPASAVKGSLQSLIPTIAAPAARPGLASLLSAGGPAAAKPEATVSPPAAVAPVAPSAKPPTPRASDKKSNQQHATSQPLEKAKAIPEKAANPKPAVPVTSVGPSSNTIPIAPAVATSSPSAAEAKESAPAQNASHKASVTANATRPVSPSPVVSPRPSGGSSASTVKHTPQPQAKPTSPPPSARASSPSKKPNPPQRPSSGQVPRPTSKSPSPSLSPRESRTQAAVSKAKSPSPSPTPRPASPQQIAISKKDRKKVMLAHYQSATTAYRNRARRPDKTAPLVHIRPVEEVFGAECVVVPVPLPPPSSPLKRMTISADGTPIPAPPFPIRPAPPSPTYCLGKRIVNERGVLSAPFKSTSSRFQLRVDDLPAPGHVQRVQDRPSSVSRAFPELKENTDQKSVTGFGSTAPRDTVYTLTNGAVRVFSHKFEGRKQVRSSSAGKSKRTGKPKPEPLKTEETIPLYSSFAPAPFSSVERAEKGSSWARSRVPRDAYGVVTIEKEQKKKPKEAAPTFQEWIGLARKQAEKAVSPRDLSKPAFGYKADRHCCKFGKENDNPPPGAYEVP